VDPDSCDWRQLADRRSGIGCDQILILEAAQDDAVAAYRVWNADGSKAEQCGNGVRCLAKYLHDRSEVTDRPFTLNGPAGPVRVQCLPDGLYRVNMGEPEFAPDRIPFLRPQPRSGLPYRLETHRGSVNIGAVSIGNPHAVVLGDLDFDLDLGSEISAHEAFPEGCNAGFIRQMDRQAIQLQVFERGTGPTRACGSGACAAVAVLRVLDRVDSTVSVDQPGGSLIIQWHGKGTDLWMTGPAAHVYQGLIDS
jgi:diaminopimelate epimerase